MLQLERTEKIKKKFDKILYKLSLFLESFTIITFKRSLVKSLAKNDAPS